MGNHEKALHFANLHLNLSKELGDEMGQATAQMNVEDLQKILGIDKIIPKDDKANNTQSIKTPASNIAASSPGRYRLRRQSMDNLNLIKVNT